jgi:hypothetical protein
MTDSKDKVLFCNESTIGKEDKCKECISEYTSFAIG